MGARARSRIGAAMTCLYILELPESEGIRKVASQDPEVTIDKVGPYFRI
jgi:hypothetical protein